MRTVARLVAFLLSLLVLELGITGLAAHLTPEEKHERMREALATTMPDALAGLLMRIVESPYAWGPLLLCGAGLLGFAIWPSGGGRARKSSKARRGSTGKKKGKQKRDGTKSELAEPEPEPLRGGVSKKERKRLRRLAESMGEEHGPEAAGDFLMQEGMLEEAARIFEENGLPERLAEIHYDQNRFEEAAHCYEQAERWEAAGSIYQQLERFEDAARCYARGDKLSVAGEMYERAENFREAGRCYKQIGFHRHAAQAFLKAGADAQAAEALVAAFDEEGGGATANEQAQREARGIAKKAGELFYKLERFDEAEAILVRAGAYASAAKVAFHTGAYDRAAELFLRIGRGDLASKALEKLDNPVAAAKALGEYLRDHGDSAEAVGHLEKAEEFQEAGDLYRQLERYEDSGRCYMQVGDYAAAAEMFRAAGDPRQAADAYQKAGMFGEAAGCMGQAGEALLQAQLVEKAGRLFEAGKAYAEHGQVDDAIRVLQLVQNDDPHFAESCALLGALFQQKGMHSLSLKKLEEATEGQPVTRENVKAYFELAQAYESQGQPTLAVDVYEKILAFDYHFDNVSERLEAAKVACEALPASRSGGEGESQPGAGRYQVVREIGRGGMGVVYLARDSVLEREVAYKVLPEQLRANPNALKNFLREAKAAAQLNHPNIVTVYDAGESEHGFYLAMELVEGTTLKEIVQRRGAVSPAGVVYILRQMAEALAYAHEKRVVHRDIKTANTMWTPGRQVKIMDFGLAKLMEEVRNATTVVSGTPFYMSPEQTLGKNVDHRTDIYSLGVTLFELATGQLPFRRGNVPYHHVHTGPPEPRELNPKVPEGLQVVILRCLEKAPESRYASANELLSALEELDLGSPEA